MGLGVVKTITKLTYLSQTYLLDANIFCQKYILKWKITEYYSFSTRLLKNEFLKSIRLLFSQNVFERDNTIGSGLKGLQKLQQPLS